MTRREISGLLEGMASRRTGYSEVRDSGEGKAQPVTRDLSVGDSERVQRSLKQRFGDRAPKLGA